MSKVKQAYRTTGMDEFANLASVEYTTVHTYVFSDVSTGGLLLIPVEPGEEVLEVVHIVNTAFDSDAALNIGDSSDSDGFIATGSLAPATAGNRVSSKGTGAAYTGGKKYASGGAIQLGYAAQPTEGAGEVHVVRFNQTKGWRENQAETYVNMTVTG